MDNDWADFRIFKLLMEGLRRRNFRVASEHLHTSQSSFSDAAKQFLEQSGVRLYELRKDNRLSPTEAGEALIELAPLLFHVRDEVIAAVKAIHRGEIRDLRLGCGTRVDPDLFNTARAIHKRYLPACQIHHSLADSAQLVAEVVEGKIDAALITLPADAPELRIELLRHDRLVALLRADDPLAMTKSVLRPADLCGRPSIFYDPARHPAAHERLLELLEEAGVQMQEHSRVSHPIDMQRLVLEGDGLAFIREGTALLAGLTTRPILGKPWTVDTAFIYHNEHHPKTIPLLVRELKRQPAAESKKPAKEAVIVPPNESHKPPAKTNGKAPEQLSLLDELPDKRLSA